MFKVASTLFLPTIKQESCRLIFTAKRMIFLKSDYNKTYSDDLHGRYLATKTIKDLAEKSRKFLGYFKKKNFFIIYLFIF